MILGSIYRYNGRGALLQARGRNNVPALVLRVKDRRLAREGRHVSVVAYRFAVELDCATVRV
jgi:hypothetical protein